MFWLAANDIPNHAFGLSHWLFAIIEFPCIRISVGRAGNKDSFSQNWWLAVDSSLMDLAAPRQPVASLNLCRNSASWWHNGGYCWCVSTQSWRKRITWSFWHLRRLEAGFQLDYNDLFTPAVSGGWSDLTIKYWNCIKEQETSCSHGVSRRSDLAKTGPLDLHLNFVYILYAEHGTRQVISFNRSVSFWIGLLSIIKNDEVW